MFDDLTKSVLKEARKRAISAVRGYLAELKNGTERPPPWETQPKAARKAPRRRRALKKGSVVALAQELLQKAGKPLPAATLKEKIKAARPAMKTSSIGTMLVGAASSGWLKRVGHGVYAA